MLTLIILLTFGTAAVAGYRIWTSPHFGLQKSRGTAPTPGSVLSEEMIWTKPPKVVGPVYAEALPTATFHPGLVLTESGTRLATPEEITSWEDAVTEENLAAEAEQARQYSLDKEWFGKETPTPVTKVKA